MDDAVGGADGGEVFFVDGHDVAHEGDTAQGGGGGFFAGLGHLDEEGDLGVGLDVLGVQGLFGEEEDGPALCCLVKSVCECE